MRWTIVTILLLPLAVAAAPPDDRDVRALVDQLAADDPAARERAATALVAKGRAARAALIEAMNGEDPQPRASASGLILRLPFDHPDDPPGVAGFTARYGQEA